MVEHLFDPPMTAKILKVKLPTIYAWVARRKIPFLKVGAALRFRPSAIEAWLKEREHLPVQKGTHEATRQPGPRNRS